MWLFGIRDLEKLGRDLCTVLCERFDSWLNSISWDGFFDIMYLPILDSFISINQYELKYHLDFFDCYAITCTVTMKQNSALAASLIC